jgi:predicted extracellular nuclease
MKVFVEIVAGCICAAMLVAGCASTSGEEAGTAGTASATDGADGTTAATSTDGADGSTATDGSNGTDGVDGTTGVDGTAGATSSTGADGSDGTTGAQGTPATLQDSAVSKGCNPSEQFSNGDVNVTMQLVLTTPVFDVSEGVKGFYAGQGSGEYSGLLVTSGQGVMFPELAQGDAVEVTGDHVEFYCMTQLRASAITRTGEGTPIEPSVLTGDVLTADVTAEPYEGVLVKLENVEVTEVTQYDFTVTGGALVTGSAFKAGFFPNVGDQIESLVGVVEFSFGKHKIQIRSAADVQSTAADATPKSISDIQQDESSANCTNEAWDLPPTQANVEVEGIVVSPIDEVSDNLNGAYLSVAASGAWSGLFVVWSNSLGFEPKIGDSVKLAGDVKEYYCSTQLMVDSFESVGTEDIPAPAIVTADAVDESYEGSYITVENPEVTSIENLEEFGEVEVNGSLIIALSDFKMSWSPTVGATVSSITGAVKYSFSKYKLVPFGDTFITE